MQLFSCEYRKIFGTAFFIKDLRWLLLITLTRFFMHNAFISSARLKLLKNQANANCQSLMCGGETGR